MGLSDGKGIQNGVLHLVNSMGMVSGAFRKRDWTMHLVDVM